MLVEQEEKGNYRYKEAQLTFDEMSIKSTLEMDKKTQTVIGPHDKVQVVMMRGLGPK